MHSHTDPESSQVYKLLFVASFLAADESPAFLCGSWQMVTAAQHLVAPVTATEEPKFMPCGDDKAEPSTHILRQRHATKTVQTTPRKHTLLHRTAATIAHTTSREPGQDQKRGTKDETTGRNAGQAKHEESKAKGKLQNPGQQVPTTCSSSK